MNPAENRWSVRDPVLRKTGARHVRAKSRADSNPIDWFGPQVLDDVGLYGVSFDFFVNWRTLELDPWVLLKLEAYLDPLGTLGVEVHHVRRVLRGYQRLGMHVHRMSRVAGLDPAWVLVPDWYEWEELKGAVLLGDVAADGLPTQVERVQVAALRERFAAVTGERFVPQKGLYWSTTALEGALSKTDTPWPGDADLVLQDEQSNLPVAVIEFRKQTQDRPLESSFGDCYPTPDGRRWDRLAILASALPGAPPLIGVHYSTHAEVQHIVVVRVEGAPRGLYEADRLELKVPAKGDPSFIAEFADRVIGDRISSARS